MAWPSSVESEGAFIQPFAQITNRPEDAADADDKSASQWSHGERDSIRTGRHRALSLP
jgi:hypothetical protein